MTEALDKAEAALARHESQHNGDPFHFPLTNHLYVALRALASEHRRLLAELDEAHAHFQVQEARIREARQVTDEMVERAALALHSEACGDEMCEHILNEFEPDARAALEAALNPKETT